MAPAIRRLAAAPQCTKYFVPSSGRQKGRPAQTKDRFTAVMGNCMRSSYSKDALQQGQLSYSYRPKILPSLFPLGRLVSQLILASRPPNTPKYQVSSTQTWRTGPIKPISRTRVEGVRERLEKSHSVILLRVM